MAGGLLSWSLVSAGNLTVPPDNLNRAKRVCWGGVKCACLVCLPRTTNHEAFTHRASSWLLWWGDRIANRTVIFLRRWCRQRKCGVWGLFHQHARH